MALAESRDIQRYIIDKYNLVDRYEIDKSDVMADIKVREQFVEFKGDRAYNDDITVLSCKIQF